MGVVNERRELYKDREGVARLARQAAKHRGQRGLQRAMQQLRTTDAARDDGGGMGERRGEEAEGGLIKRARERGDSEEQARQARVGSLGERGQAV